MSNQSNTFHQSNVDHVPTVVDASGTIRQRVDNRHWQLFEARLNHQLPDTNKENYTNTNDYRIINRLKKTDQPQLPVEPNRRWETFCQHVTKQSNETDRVMSIFQHVWQTNWNTKRTDNQPKRMMSNPQVNKTTLFEQLPINDNDRKVISSIIHRTISTENVSSNKDKKNLI